MAYGKTSHFNTHEDMKHFSSNQCLCQKGIGELGEKERETLLFNYHGTDMENRPNLKGAQ